MVAFLEYVVSLNLDWTVLGFRSTPFLFLILMHIHTHTKKKKKRSIHKRKNGKKDTLNSIEENSQIFTIIEN